MNPPLPYGVVNTHKEVRHTCIKEDAADRAKIRETLSTCIDILDTSKHPDTGLINVFSGRVIDDPTVNVHEAVEIGVAEQWAFEGGWPASFHLKLTKKVKDLKVPRSAIPLIPARAKFDPCLSVQRQ